MPASIVLGVEVYGSDGKILGKVKHFFSAAPEASPQAGAEDETVDKETVDIPAGMGGVATAGGPAIQSAPAPGTNPAMSLTMSDTKYFECHHGGLLHIGGESLYIPFAAVAVVEDDNSLVLRCTADEAAVLYAQKPPPLDTD
jgi:hypothetical protein